VGVHGERLDVDVVEGGTVTAKTVTTVSLLGADNSVPTWRC